MRRSRVGGAVDGEGEEAPRECEQVARQSVTSVTSLSCAGLFQSTIGGFTCVLEFLSLETATTSFWTQGSAAEVVRAGSATPVTKAARSDTNAFYRTPLATSVVTK